MAKKTKKATKVAEEAVEETVEEEKVEEKKEEETEKVWKMGQTPPVEAPKGKKPEEKKEEPQQIEIYQAGPTTDDSNVMCEQNRIYFRTKT